MTAWWKRHEKLVERVATAGLAIFIAGVFLGSWWLWLKVKYTVLSWLGIL